MRLFRCQACGQTVYFENTQCERCGHRLGYLPDIGLMSALEPEVAAELIDVLEAVGLLGASGLQRQEQDVWLAQVRPGHQYRFCANAAYAACNWLVPAEAKTKYCTACRHNRRIANLDHAENRERWRRLERAKHRLIYSLLKLGLPMPTRPGHPQGLAFDFLTDPADTKLPRVLTGHAKGLITIALREADDVERETMRKGLGEPYRTLLGHFRHESGHFFWDRLVRDGGAIEACRAVFGDEREDYGKALKSYYAKGPRPGWHRRVISAYATMHPWEDFAETWAHYLHMIDTLETAGAHGMQLHSRDSTQPRTVAIDFDPYRVTHLDPVIESWLPLSLAANSLNRSMGLPDLYPFVLSGRVVEKLRFIHALVQQHRSSSPAPAA